MAIYCSYVYAIYCGYVYDMYMICFDVATSKIRHVPVVKRIKSQLREFNFAGDRKKRATSKNLFLKWHFNSLNGILEVTLTNKC